MMSWYKLSCLAQDHQNQITRLKSKLVELASEESQEGATDYKKKKKAQTINWISLSVGLRIRWLSSDEV